MGSKPLGCTKKSPPSCKFTAAILPTVETISQPGGPLAAQIPSKSGDRDPEIRSGKLREHRPGKR